MVLLLRGVMREGPSQWHQVGTFGSAYRGSAVSWQVFYDTMELVGHDELGDDGPGGTGLLELWKLVGDS